MPTSNPVVIVDVVNLVAQVPHRWVLDVGPGYGKFGLLLREMLNVKPERIDAVEVHAPYVTEFHWLHCLYDDVMVGDVLDMDSIALHPYDVVLMSDVLEHLPRDAAVELLQRIPGRVVISTPRDYFDTGPGLPASEAHVSHWPQEEIEAVAATMGRGVEVAYTNDVGAVLVRLAPRAQR